MTREEARREIDSLDFYLQNHTDDYSEESHMAMVMAIKALEKEPCEDVISRQAVLDMATTIETDDYSGNELLEVVYIDDIKELPSVTLA